MSGPAASDDQVPTLRSCFHGLFREISGVHGLHEIVAAAIDREDRKAAQRPGDVVDQDVAFPKDQGRPDDGVGDADALQRFFHLPFAPEVGQPGV